MTRIHKLAFRPGRSGRSWLACNTRALRMRWLWSTRWCDVTCKRCLRRMR